MSASFVDSVLLLRCDGDQGNPLKHLAPCVWGSDLFVGLFSIAFHSFNSCQIFCGIHIQCCCFFGLKMTQFLPPNLLALFAPRDPIPFLPQLEKLPHEKYHNQPYSGIAPFIRHFEVMETYFIHVLWSLTFSVYFLRIPISFISPFLTRTLEMPLHRQGQRHVKSGWRERWDTNTPLCSQQSC